MQAPGRQKKIWIRPCWWEDCSWEDWESRTVLAPILMKRSCVVAVEKILIKIQRALQHRGIFVLDPLCLCPCSETIHLPDNIRSARTFPPLLKNFFETSEPRQQRKRVKALWFQKVAFMGKVPVQSRVWTKKKPILSNLRITSFSGMDGCEDFSPQFFYSCGLTPQFCRSVRKFI